MIHSTIYTVPSSHNSAKAIPAPKLSSRPHVGSVSTPHASTSVHIEYSNLTTDYFSRQTRRVDLPILASGVPVEEVGC